jgi:hypothetical protein
MFDLTSIGRWVVLIGIALIVIGGGLWLAGRSGLPLGKLPGDFQFEFGSISCLFPLASSILISLVLTLVLNLLIRILNR